MTWIDSKSPIVTKLKSMKYHEVEFNLDLIDEVPVSRRNKCFTLKVPTKSIANITSGASLNTNNAELKVSYICNNTNEYDLAVDEWNTVLEHIYQYIGSYLSEPTFERNEENNKYFVGTAQFDVGSQVCQ